MRPPRPQGHSIEEIYENLFQNYLRSTNNIDLYYLNPKLTIRDNIREIRSFKADIIHITGDVYYYAFFLFFFHKIILTIHDVGHYKELKHFKKVIYRYIWLQLPIFLSKKITTVSQATKEDLIRILNVPEDKISIIHNPLPNTSINILKNELSNPPIILQVGTGHNKNLETVIKAIGGLNVRMYIIGYLSLKQKDLLESNNVTFNNFVNLEYSHVISLYSKADIVTFVSLHEGFGMPIIEANVIGTPVITSSLPVIKEIGNDAVYYIKDPLDTKEVKNAILHILNDDDYRIDLKNKGFNNAKRFSGERISEQYLQLYKNVN